MPDKSTIYIAGNRLLDTTSRESSISTIRRLKDSLQSSMCTMPLGRPLPLGRTNKLPRLAVHHLVEKVHQTLDSYVALIMVNMIGHPRMELQTNFSSYETRAWKPFKGDVSGYKTARWRSWEARGLLSSLGLVGKVTSEVPMRNLLSRQRVRLALAEVLWDPPHMLMLDELTTHLGPDSIQALALRLRRVPRSDLAHDIRSLLHVMHGRG
jgi:ABC-type branched-subunit amino acid transport system ATPase component